MVCEDSLKNPITGSKYAEYVPENRDGPGCWGVLPTNPNFFWFGLVKEFTPPEKESYEETSYSGAYDETHTLELQRNTNVDAKLTASVKYAIQNWDFMEYIMGSATGFSDVVDSFSVVYYADSKWVVLKGGMLLKWSLNIPVSGIATVDADMVFGDITAPSATDPKGTSGAHASELSIAPFIWKNITNLKMDINDPPTTSLTDIVEGVTITITNDAKIVTGVDSTYTTKGVGVIIHNRKIEVSLDLTYINLATFQNLVAGHTKQNLSFELGGKKITIYGLLFPEWVAELKPGELVGQTVTAITDLPAMTIESIGYFLLLEMGDRVLLESGDMLLL